MPERPFKHDPAVGRLVERQMRNWQLLREQSPALTENGRQLHDFVFISRVAGSNGIEVGRIVGEKLGWPVFDKQVLQTMSGDDDFRRRLYASMDERDMSWIEEATRAFLETGFVKNDYFRRMAEAILSLARGSPAVFIGRGAGLVLPRDRGLRVRIVANPDECVRQYAERMKMDIGAARKELSHLEKERAEFIKHHFHVDLADPALYDLTLNLDHLTLSQAAELILTAHRLRMTGSDGSR